MFPLEDIQNELKAQQLEGWLLYDFRRSNPLACRIAQIPSEQMGSRRWFYYIPAEGTPTRIVHAIEQDMLDHLPGESQVYLAWQLLEERLKGVVKSGSRIAMEYASRAGNPYVSRVDAGTIELIQSFGAEVLSSGNLIQQFEATLSAEQWESHQFASAVTESAFGKAWSFIETSLKAGNSVKELDVQQVIMEHFAAHQLVTYHPPIVAVGPNSGLPHYETGTGAETTITPESHVLIDLWAKQSHPGAIYSDLTKMAYVGSAIPQENAHRFSVIAQARDEGVQLIRQRVENQQQIAGWEVDEIVREVIAKAGFGDDFTHRTGHSLGEEVHGNGAHLDNIETREERLLLPRTLFTIEPGIYRTDFGVRTEINVYLSEQNEVIITGGTPQTEMQLITI